MTRTPVPVSHRLLLRAGGSLAALAAFRPAGAAEEVLRRSTTPAASAPSPRVAFLTPAAAATALAHAPGDRFYDGMGMLEIRARLKSPLPGMSLAQARAAVRADEAAATLPFSDAEQAAIRGVLDRMQARLAARAPLYARTPWSFIKLDDRAEGGMPHTRGPHIVLPRAVTQLFTALEADGLLEPGFPADQLLVHEQTHVIQRAWPARFEPLLTTAFGFTRMTPAPTTPWLDAHVITNPDAPELCWAFPLERLGGRGWVMPFLALPDVEALRIPRDFRAVAVELARDGETWSVVEDGGVPRMRPLESVPGWREGFPFPDENFHPNEIAAVTLSHWILQDVPDLDRRQLMPAVAAWARTGLA